MPRLRTIIVIGALLNPAFALADGEAGSVGSVLEQVDVTSGAGNAAVSLRFSCRLRYVSQYPAAQSDYFRITLAPLPGCRVPSTLEDHFRAPAGNAAGLAEATLSAEGSGVMLTLHFSRFVQPMVRPTTDFQGLDVTVPAAPASVARRDRELISPVPPLAPTRSLPPPEELERQFSEARAAFDTRDYQTAVRLFTRMVEYPEHARRAESQELLALSRERLGQLAHAKAEYQEYLRRYPNGPGAHRVSQRLAAIVTLDRQAPAKQRTEASRGAWNWDSDGMLAQEYRHDATHFEAGGVSADIVGQSVVVTDMDASIRGRSDSLNIQARVNAGYLYDLRPEDAENSARVSTAYLDVSDRARRRAVRIGRQSRNAGGVGGTFDGLHLGWRTGDRTTLHFTTGLPTESTHDAPDASRQFVSLSADFRGTSTGWEISPFLLVQQFEGYADRQAVGSEFRYFQPGRTLVGLVDYDFHYSAINAAMLLGTWETASHWTITGTLDHRKSPFLTTRNALIGQPVQSFSGLVEAYGLGGVEQLAQDRTGDMNMASLGLSRPIGSRYQLSTDFTLTQMSALPESGGVPELPGTGTQIAWSGQLIANDLFRDGDVAIAGLQWFDSSTAQVASLMLSARVPLWYGLRFGPRLRLDHRDYSLDGSTQWTVSPSVRIDWLWRKAIVELEIGGEWESRRLPLSTSSANRVWFVLDYRVPFGVD